MTITLNSEEEYNLFNSMRHVISFYDEDPDHVLRRRFNRLHFYNLYQKHKYLVELDEEVRALERDCHVTNLCPDQPLRTKSLGELLLDIDKGLKDFGKPRARLCRIPSRLTRGKRQTQPPRFINEVSKLLQCLSIISTNFRSLQEKKNEISMNTIMSKRDGRNVRFTLPPKRGWCIDALTDVSAVINSLRDSLPRYVFDESSSHIERHKYL